MLVSTETRSQETMASKGFLIMILLLLDYASVSHFSDCGLMAVD